MRPGNAALIPLAHYCIHELVLVLLAFILWASQTFSPSPRGKKNLPLAY